eukprot:g24000.t1
MEHHMPSMVECGIETLRLGHALSADFTGRTDHSDIGLQVVFFLSQAKRFVTAMSSTWRLMVFSRILIYNTVVGWNNYRGCIESGEVNSCCSEAEGCSRIGIGSLSLGVHSVDHVCESLEVGSRHDAKNVNGSDNYAATVAAAAALEF